MSVCLYKCARVCDRVTVYARAYEPTNHLDGRVPVSVCVWCVHVYVVYARVLMSVCARVYEPTNHLAGRVSVAGAAEHVRPLKRSNEHQQCSQGKQWQV